MIVRIAALALVLAFVPDERDDLLAAAKKAAEAKSYSFRGETKLRLPEGLAKSGGADPVRFEGKVERETGAWVKTDAHEFIMAGGKTASRPVPEWRAVKDDDGDDVQRLLYQALAGVRSPRPPHEDFASWPRAVAAARRTDAKEKIGDRDCRVYEAEFTPEASRDLLRSLFPIGKWLDRLPIDKPTAAARAWIDADNRILKLETTANVPVSLQGADSVLTATRTILFTDHDATKVQIPDEARKILGSK